MWDSVRWVNMLNIFKYVEHVKQERHDTPSSSSAMFGLASQRGPGDLICPWWKETLCRSIQSRRASGSSEWGRFGRWDALKPSLNWNIYALYFGWFALEQQMTRCANTMSSLWYLDSPGPDKEFKKERESKAASVSGYHELGSFDFGFSLIILHVFCTILPLYKGIIHNSYHFIHYYTLLTLLTRSKSFGIRWATHEALTQLERELAAERLAKAGIRDI